MNENSIKTFMIFTIGVATGAGSAILIMKNKYEKLVQEEIDSIREVQDRKKDNSEEKSVWVIDDEDKTIMIDYAEMAGTYDGGTIQDHYISEDQLKEARADADKPYIISVEDFSEEMPHYDKETILYYEVDNTLADNNDEIIQDVSGTIGDNALESFGVDSDDEDIVYIRNGRLGIDYEVIRQHKSFAEYIS